MITEVRPVELRYYLGQVHYRSEIDYSPAALTEAATAYQRIEGFVTRAAELVGPDDASTGVVLADTASLPAAFTAAMDDDLGVPQALALVHDSVREGNAALAVADAAGTAKSLGEVRAMLAVLGLDPLAPPWADSGSATGLRSVVDALVRVALEQREAARGRKDYAAADAIRAQLAQAGVTVEDTPRGPRWELRT
jgi:cysteinyl-tRNA synthetase